jgi:hypothetical protein
MTAVVPEKAPETEANLTKSKRSATIKQIEKELKQKREEEEQEKELAKEQAKGQAKGAKESGSTLSARITTAPKNPLSEEELISTLLSYVFQVSTSASNGNYFFLPELAKELAEENTSFLSLRNVDSIIMEVSECKRKEMNPSMPSFDPF